MDDRNGHSRSALAVADDAFMALTTGPGALELDCSGIGFGIPAGPVGLADLRQLLASPQTSRLGRQACWERLAELAGMGRPAWTVAAAGMAIPALVRIAGGLYPGYGGDPVDLDSEVLTGFVAGLRRTDPHTTQLPIRLTWTALCAGLAAQHANPVPGADSPVVAALPRRPWGEPARLLTEAVGTGALSGWEAVLIRRTRLQHTTLIDCAEEIGAAAEELAVARAAAEARLADAILLGLLAPVPS